VTQARRPLESSDQADTADQDREWSPVSLFGPPLTADGWEETLEFFDTDSNVPTRCDPNIDLRKRPIQQVIGLPSSTTYTEQERLPFLAELGTPRALAPREVAVLPPPTRLNDSQTVEKLLHHYRTHVARLMMPTSAPSQNPYLCIYLPLALQNPSGDAKEGLLLAILAVAAFNKAELDPVDAKTYRNQAINFAERAATILKSYTRPGADGKQRPGPVSEVDRKALLATVVTMTTIEVSYLLLPRIHSSPPFHLHKAGTGADMPRQIFSGGQHGKGYESLLLGKHIIAITGGAEWWVADPMRLTLLQIYRCLEIVAHTSGWKPPVTPSTSIYKPATNNWSLTTAPRTTETNIAPQTQFPPATTSASTLLTSRIPIPGEGGHYTLDISFGVARRTLQSLNKTIELSTLHSPTPPHWPDTTHASLRQLEADIFDILDDFPNALAGEGNDGHASAYPNLLGGTSTTTANGNGLQEGPAISDYVNEEIRENHVWAFHYASALFFRRAICNGHDGLDAVLPSPSDAPTTTTTTSKNKQRTGQDLVASALDHLENIDVLSGDAVVANTLWPAFIAAVEAVQTPLRHRALTWFVRAKRHGIGNIAKAKALAMEVWRRVDRQSWFGPSSEKRGDGVGVSASGLSRVDWRKVMREMDMYIMLT
jgi:hypothetical protein